MSQEPAASIVLLVTGSRSITHQSIVDKHLDALPFLIKQLVHGGAAGVDTCAGRWAQRHGIPVLVVRPDFRKWPMARHRWRAYTERDYDTVRRADRVVAIWDGQSSGTRKTFEYAETLQKLHSIHLVKH